MMIFRIFPMSKSGMVVEGNDEEIFVIHVDNEKAL